MTLVHVAVLVAICAIVYFPALDAMGVYAWQEGQRLIVAREMNERLTAATSTRDAMNALLLPTSHATPYIAKPPLFYWLQIILARLTNSNVELWHIRLVVALSGMLGVLATYAAARTLLRTDRDTPTPIGLDGVPMHDAFAAHAALWAGVTLATAPLWAHASRIGEVDITLASFCTVAMVGVALAWRSHRLRRRTSIPAVALATLATTAATFTKDPGVLIVALAGYGAILLFFALAPIGTRFDIALLPSALGGDRGRAPLMPCPPAPTHARLLTRALPGVAAISAAVTSWRTIEHTGEVLGVAIIAAMAAFVAFVVSRLSEPARFRAAFVALSRTHPVAVLGIPIALAVLWRVHVAALIGPEAARALVNQEVDDNLRLLIAEAPLNNLEALSWGGGLASAGLIFALLWFLKDRPRVPAPFFLVIAWIVFPLIAFSLLGKGVQRYLTPVWPGVAIVAGVCIASLLAANPFWRTTARGPRVLVPALVIIALSLALGQAWFFAVQRVRTKDAYSPRDFVAALRQRPDVNLDHLVSINFSSPALAYYAGQRIEPVGETGVNTSMSGGAALTFEQFAQVVRTRGPMLALMREEDTAENSADAVPSVRLRSMGLSVQRLEPHPTARFLSSSGSAIHCYRIGP